MKITYSHIELQFRDTVEAESARHVERLNRLLKRYPPDATQLHCSIEKTPRKTEFGFSVNLTLSTGTLHATGYGAEVRTSVKAAFAELDAQVKKHQAKLRKDYVWKRKRARGVLRPGELPTMG
jgi:ribosome-associated translation inhibitor RaiA